MKQNLIKFMFSKKATKIDEIFTVDWQIPSDKSTVKISSFFVAFLENTNFIWASFGWVRSTI